MKKTNSHKNDSALTEKEPFFDRPEVIQWSLRIFYICCVILLVLDFIVHRHIYTDIEKIPAFYALFGSISCAALLLIAKLVRKLLMRDEEYYEPLDPQADKQYTEGFSGHESHDELDHAIKKNTMHKGG